MLYNKGYFSLFDRSVAVEAYDTCQSKGKEKTPSKGCFNELLFTRAILRRLENTPT